MKDFELGAIQERFADIVWAHEPVASGELAKICEKELNWKRPTTYTVLRKLCEKGLLGKNKTRGFSEFARRWGVEALLDCLEANEQRGVVYHRQGITGDYDGFDDVQTLLAFIRTGSREP